MIYELDVCLQTMANRRAPVVIIYSLISGALLLYASYRLAGAILQGKGVISHFFSYAILQSSLYDFPNLAEINV